MKKPNANTLALIAILIAVILGGGIPAITKISIKDIPPFSFSFLRFIAASIVILPFFLRNRPKLDKNSYKVILMSLLLSLNVIIFPLGVRLTTATISQLIYVAVPILVAVLSYFLLSEKLKLQKGLGICLGLIGTMIIIALPQFLKNTPFGGNFEGNMIILVGAVATALYTVFSKRFQKQYTPLQLTAIFSFTTTFILIFLAILDLKSSPLWWKHLELSASLGTLYVGILGTAVCYGALQYAIKHGSPLIASLSFYLQPAAAFVWAFFLLGEQLTTGLVVGSLLAFAGVFLVLKAK